MRYLKLLLILFCWLVLVGSSRNIVWMHNTCSDCSKRASGSELFWDGEHTTSNITTCTEGDTTAELGGGATINTPGSQPTVCAGDGAADESVYFADGDDAQSMQWAITGGDIWVSDQGCIDFWVYQVSTANATRTIFEAHTDVNNRLFIKLINDQTLSFWHESGGNEATDTSTCTVTQDAWTHAVIKWDAAGSYPGGTEIAISCNGGSTWEYQDDDDLASFAGAEPANFKSGCTQNCTGDGGDDIYLDDINTFITADCT